jgi:SpoVK/Ycf46/Vps4 family AAA+-type ATPase
MPLPSPEDYRNTLKQLYDDLSRRTHIQIRMSREELNRLIKNLQGFTLLETKKILTRAIIEGNCLSAESIKKVVEAKKDIIEKDGLLEYYPVNEKIQDIADLAGLKDWLAKRSFFMAEPEKAVKMGLTFPKGILLLGIPGTGKSLCAKAVSNEWGIPLLKMDTSRLYSKYLGETEQNFRRAMDTAEKMAPVVLWIDEIEKALASGGEEDGGVSKRVLGTFLTWMQDRRGDVFVVATANDIHGLPPELLRKGRFDELFFLGLPDILSRTELFRILLDKRGYAPDRFDCGALASAAEGFTGADIEQAICSALYSAAAGDKPLDTEAILREVRDTCPISKTRAEYIGFLTAWAKGRTRGAN